MVDFLAGSVTIPLPGINAAIDPQELLVRLLVLVPLVGGYILARESRGKHLLLEVVAVVLLVLATVVPVHLSVAELAVTWNAFLGRWPMILFLMGLSFVRDGGFKMGIGIALLAFSGYIILPTQ